MHNRIWEITIASAHIQYVRRIRLIRRTTIRAPPLSAWRVYIYLYARGGRTYIYARRVRARKTRARAIPGRILLHGGARGGVARQEQDASYIYIYIYILYTYIHTTSIYIHIY